MNLLILLKFKNTLNIDTKKATGFDKIPPKLVKLSAEVLSTPLSIAINKGLKYGVFPDDAKITTKVNQAKMKSPILGQ